MRAVQNPWVSASDKVRNLRRILFESDELTIMPCCYDGLTARLVEQSGFQLTFMTGFGVSSTYGLPDTGIYSNLTTFFTFLDGIIGYFEMRSFLRR